MKIGLLFAGQGAQYPGMGKSLYEKSAAAKKVFDEAGDQIKDRCFNGTKETLRQTKTTQPCIYTVTMAAYCSFLEETAKFDKRFWGKIEPAGVAGFSLGEYSALTAAGVIDDIGKGLDIVTKRGELMFAAGSDENGNPKGGMAAAFGNRRAILKCVEAAREDGILEGVNFNSQVQTVVAGDNGALERFRKIAAEGRIKVIPLTVGTAFHSPMMAPAAEPLRQILLKSDLKASVTKVYCNLTGRDMFEGNSHAGEDITGYVADIMAKQVKSPVYWQETIEHMAGDGINTFIEIGPGTTLSGIVKKISHDNATLNIDDGESLEKTMRALSEMIGAEGESSYA